MKISHESDLIVHLNNLDIESVIIDFDGVIVDSEPIQAESYVSTLDKIGVNISSFSFNKYVGKNEQQIWNEIFNDYKFEHSVSELSTTRNSIVAEKILYQNPSWFINTIFKSFSTDTKFILLSSGVGNIINSYLEKWELKTFFSDFYMSSDNKEPIDKKNILIGLINNTPQTNLVIEDSIDYSLLSKKIGSETIWIQHSLNQQNLKTARENNLPTITLNLQEKF